jgi:dihydroorotase-like cyclic amidohydrolase
LSRFDLLVRGGTVVTPGGAEPHDVGVVDGLIAAIEPDLEGAARETIDATGLHVFPGVVDAHVHCNDPGRADWEGLAHGNRALAVGGTTAFIDMPLNASPPTLDAVSFDLKVAAASGTAHVDFALWGVSCRETSTASTSWQTGHRRLQGVHVPIGHRRALRGGSHSRRLRASWPQRPHGGFASRARGHSRPERTQISSSSTSMRCALTTGELLSLHRLSPFVGRQLPERVVRTIVRGSTVCLGGDMVAEAAGRLLRPTRTPTEARL